MNFGNWQCVSFSGKNIVALAFISFELCEGKGCFLVWVLSSVSLIINLSWNILFTHSHWKEECVLKTSLFLVFILSKTCIFDAIRESSSSVNVQKGPFSKHLGRYFFHFHVLKNAKFLNIGLINEQQRCDEWTTALWWMNNSVVMNEQQPLPPPPQKKTLHVKISSSQNGWCY